jgi:hypothetical protein
MTRAAARVYSALHLPTDDNPGNTSFVDVYSMISTSAEHDGGSQDLAKAVGEDVASTMINGQAETVCV